MRDCVQNMFIWQSNSLRIDLVTACLYKVVLPDMPISVWHAQQMAVDRAVQELNEAFKQSGLVNFLNTVLLVLEILRIFALVNVICLPISFPTDPLGLIQRFTKKENESDEQAWNRCFCCILIFYGYVSFLVSIVSHVTS